MFNLNLRSLEEVGSCSSKQNGEAYIVGSPVVRTLEHQVAVCWVLLKSL